MARMSAGAGYQYLLRHTACGDVQRDPSTPLTAYYTASGYPPGTWHGDGLAGLGIATGSTVTEEQMTHLYGHGHHPVTGQPLGRSYPVFRTEAQRISDAVAQLSGVLDPGQRATAVDAITRLEKSRQPRAAVAGFDLTFTAPKSASVLWALADAGVQATVVEAHRAAVRDALAFVQDRALFTRIGRNSIAQVPTRGLAAALFDHWDTRTGDPNLHTHVVVANKVQGLDGQWRSLDSRALHHAAVAVSELYDNLFADHLTAALGASWSWRPRGPRRTPAYELDAVPDELLREFSTRSAAITTALTDAIAAFRDRHGRTPNRVETTRLRQRANTSTRPAKTLHPLPALMTWWRDRARRLLRRAPHPLLAHTWASSHSQPAAGIGASGPLTGDSHRHHRHDGGPVTAPPVMTGATGLRGTVGSLRSRLHVPSRRDRQGQVLAVAVSDEVVDRYADAVLDAVLTRRSTWTRWNLVAEAARVTRNHRCHDAAARVALHDRVVTTALAQCVALTGPDRWTVPEQWQRPDGTSVFTQPDQDRFTHHIVLDAETRLLAATTATDAPGVDISIAEAAAHALQAPRHRDQAPVRLAQDQVDAVTGIATSHRVLDVLVGPAGTGKTTTLRALRTAWETQHGTGTVIGLAPSATAAHELAAALGISCENTAKWVHESAGPAGRQRADARTDLTDRRARAVAVGEDRTVRRIDAALRRITEAQDRWQLAPGTLLIIDEASLAGTLTLDTLAAQAAASGAKVVLVGDHHQLGAVDAGGAFGLLADTPHAYQLRSLWRFTNRWEAHATRALRDGNPGVIDTYDRHHRIHAGAAADALDAAYNAWLSDNRTGTALLIAADTGTVTALNHRAHTDRAVTGHVDSTRTVRLADGLDAGIGDLVIARRNDRRLTTTLGDHVRNGTRWTITTLHDDGSVELATATRAGAGEASESSDRLQVPADYVAGHLELGYATTIHRAQGLTVDHAHLIITPAMSREALYVGLTRGRHSNHAYIPDDHIDEDCEHLPDPGRVSPDPHEQLARILATSGRERSATEHLRSHAHGPTAREIDAVMATISGEYNRDDISSARNLDQQHARIVEKGLQR